MPITISTEQVIATLNTLQSRAQNMQPVYAEMGQALKDNILLELGEGKSAWGIDFFPLLKPRKSNQGFGLDVPLNDTRQHIYNKINFRADSRGVDIGILEAAPIGATHQFGSEDKNIPARPFLPIVGNTVDLPNDWNAEIMAMIERHLAAL